MNANIKTRPVSHLDALIAHLHDDGETDISADDLRIVYHAGEGCYMELGDREWLVCDQWERETACDERLDCYIDECIIPELPENLQGYFDYDAWKRDAKLSDGYGHTIATYDGEEHEQRDPDTGEWFFIYRTN